MAKRILGGMRPLLLPVLLLALVTSFARLEAQGPRPQGLHQLAQHHLENTVPVVRLDSLPRTHWKTGMIIGGAFGLLVDVWGQLMYRSHCESDCKALAPLGFLIGSPIVFGTIGGLIGSGFKKH